MAQMRDNDGAAYNKGHIHPILDLLPAIPGFHTLFQMVVNTIVAAQNHGSDQAKQLLRFTRQGPIAIAL